jgi:hypothetical protein
LELTAEYENSTALSCTQVYNFLTADIESNSRLSPVKCISDKLLHVCTYWTHRISAKKTNLGNFHNKCLQCVQQTSAQYPPDHRTTHTRPLYNDHKTVGLRPSDVCTMTIRPLDYTLQIAALYPPNCAM